MGRDAKRSVNSAAWTCRFVLAAALHGAAAAGLIAPAAAGDSWAPETTICTKSQFESAVDEAAVSLRDLNNRNRPEFQTRLRELKEKRGWTDDQFLKEAAPFVQDDRIAVFDAESNKLLASISSMGTVGASAQVPDCAMLSELRRLMSVLIDTQAEKWTYMFEKLDAELAK